MAASASAVRVCPICGELSNEVQFWTVKCDAAWSASQKEVA